MKYQQILNLAQRYDKAIEHLENNAIARLNKSFDNAYKQLLGQIKLSIYTQKRQYNLLNRNVFVAEQLREILDLFITDNNREDTLNVLLQTAAQQGVFFSAQVADVAFANIPVEAIAFQTQETYKRLIRHGESFAEDVTNIVGSGLAQGWGERQITTALNTRLGILKGRAEDIARTESIKAYSNTSQQRFLDAGIDEIIWLTVKENVCKFCSWRNGKVFKIGSVIHPPHPRCRCVLIPRVGEDEADFLKDYPKYEGENPGVAPFEKTAGFTKVEAITDLILDQTKIAG